MKQYVETLLTGFLFISVPSVLVAAQQHKTGEDPQKVTLEMMIDFLPIHKIQLILLTETTEPATHILQTQQEQQTMQQTRITNERMDKQTSVSDGDFYQTSLFSCRGFA